MVPHLFAAFILCQSAAPDLAVGPIHRVETALRMPAAARAVTAAISVDREAIERFAQGGGGVLHMPLGSARQAELELQPCGAFHEGARVEAMSRAKGGALVATEVPVRGAFLSGRVAGETDSHAFLAVSDAGTFGYVESQGHTYIISSGPYGRGLPTVSYDLTAMPPGFVDPPAWTCATPAPEAAPEQPGDGGIAGVPPCRQVRIAFDTDHEFLLLFGGNASAATGYISTLASALTSIYTRDVNTRLAAVYSRLWTTPSDPWTATNTSDQLGQFEGYWGINMTSISRDIAHFLSGRGLGGGVAYLPGLCNGPPFGVSANLAGFFPTPLIDNNGQNWDIMVTAHELGHNFGSPHTHNYAPPIDGCGSSPQDCTAAAAGEGTIMSYCHICGGGMSNIKLRFHPGNIATMLQHLGSVGCNYTGPARAPLAFIDRVSVAAATPTLIDVLANEAEFNCEAVSIEFPQNPTFGGGLLSVSAGTGPGGRDQVLYTMPNASFSGTDTFTYRLRDTSGQIAIASVVPTVSAVRAPENPIGALPQLSLAYYALVAPGALPNFDALAPYQAELAPAINYPSTNGAFSTSGRADDVGAVFTGWIDVPAGGNWTFFTTSDDGSRLKIGATTVVNNDGLHGMVEQSGTISLAAGRHAFRVEFFERGGGAGLIASWQGPGVAKAVIPAANLLHGGVDSPADIDNSGAVDGADLTILLGSWGSASGPADINRDGGVDGADLTLLLDAWAS
ncbi:MAG: hypothetical protein RLZZ116_2440 [Planctomycetota bacterium]|jgi:hypothetical protein